MADKESEEMQLSRGRVNRELRTILNHSLTLVFAPMGYGKTTAVRDFLRLQEIEPVWVQLLEGDGTAAYFWDRLTLQVSKRRRELGQTLNSLGFPADTSQRTKIIDIICDEDFPEPVVLVLDDFHLVKDPDVFRIITLIIRQEIKNLHIVIITRETESLDIPELTRLCATITMDTLRFRQDEVRAYFHMMGIAADHRMIEEVTGYTDGWIAMIYLIMLGIQRGLPMRRVDSVGELVERNLYAPADDETKEILKQLSLMDSFTARQADYVLERENMDIYLRRMKKLNALIIYDETDRIYKIHNILLDFLRDYAGLPEKDKKKIFHRLGDWYMSQKEYLDAFISYLNAEEPEIVLTAMNSLTPPNLTYSQFLSLMELFGGCPEDVRIKYPLAFLHYSAMLFMSGSEKLAEEGAGILAGLKKHYEHNEEVHKNYRSFILGEISVCSIFASFNDAEAMSHHVSEALRLFEGSQSLVAPRKGEFTFGSPHFLYSYYRKPGQLLQTVETICTGFKGFAEAADGCGTGCDDLSKAEYALETLDLHTAELNALRAMYKARTKDQVSIIACALFTLIRLSLARGKITDAMEFLSQVTEVIGKENNTVLNTTLDLIRGYVYGVLGEENKIPEWLRTGDISAVQFIFQMAWNNIIYGKSLLLQGDYIKLDVMCESFQANFNVFQNQLGHIHNHIHRSVAKYYLEGEANGAAELEKALMIGQQDCILLPFAENYPHIRPVLKAVQMQEREIDGKYLERVIRSGKQYSKNNPVRNSTDIILTEREKEVLQLLAEGLSREELAGRLYLSLSTVKTHIANIYRKLGAGNRTAVIKKASELGLLKI